MEQSLNITLLWPSAWKPPFITQHYGERKAYYARFGLKDGHEGTDFRAPTGTEIMAAADGELQIVAVGRQYGMQVWIRHDAEGVSYQTLYAHLSRFRDGLKRGQHVRAGEVIGYAGSTGNSSAAHLHFGVRLQGRWINPEPYLVKPEAA